MRPVALSVLLATVGFCASPAGAADLTKIERTIAKEPAYKGRPKYFLLVFGPDAKHRAWLVADDEAIYVDRKGNGDLTENGNRVPWNKTYSNVGDLAFADGKVQYRGLSVKTRTIRKGPIWTIELSSTHSQRVSRDAQGSLAPADKPQDAPLIHFDGPLAMALLSYCDGETPVLTRGSKASEIAASIGTPGIGKGTFAYVVPPKQALALKPLAEVEFTHRDLNEKPIKVSVRLAVPEDGCLSFNGPIQVPTDAAGNKAKLTLSFADWKEGGVAPRTSEVAIMEPKPSGKPN